ncbi:MAG: hypothetical protein UX13_C0015G0013 [Candidatus Woesebacteria bacterium GW2011_GWB1_45_5]|uniref:Uncharacterized protein n=1 Tax=Candidatus Woesebacteria bacterium GW2011_GWB1_45_5 TaxID=1618581 RepID=A0A0G1MQ43_9BACT|nr:MAG: hypothetical protein UX13_C0015G0013 [Candidatus Woesebacteria bacterium GW2011_GWB1_45_5]
MLSARVAVCKNRERAQVDLDPSGKEDLLGDCSRRNVKKPGHRSDLFIRPGCLVPPIRLAGGGQDMDRAGGIPRGPKLNTRSSGKGVSPDQQQDVPWAWGYLVAVAEFETRQMYHQRNHEIDLRVSPGNGYRRINSCDEGGFRYWCQGGSDGRYRCIRKSVNVTNRNTNGFIFIFLPSFKAKKKRW